MKPEISNDELVVLVSRVDGVSKLHNYTLTTKQLIYLSGKSSPSRFEQLINEVDLTEGFITFCIRSGTVWKTEKVFTHGKHLKIPPHHIKTGLAHRVASIREAAANHPCCTDEQRVKFHLKSG